MKSSTDKTRKLPATDERAAQASEHLSFDRNFSFDHAPSGVVVLPVRRVGVRGMRTGRKRNAG